MTIHSLASQHSWLREDGLAENAVVNTFSWYWDDSVSFSDADEVGAEIKSRLQAFYAHFADDYSSYMTGDITLKVYDRADPEPRVPIYQDTYAPPAVSGSRAPGEIALVCSFKEHAIAGVNPARRRGRVFLGPFGPTAFTSVTSGTRPSTDLMEEIQDAGQELLEANGGGLALGVYSPTDNGLVIVDEGWVDNAFDTMRSRGIAPSARLRFDDGSP